MEIERSNGVIDKNIKIWSGKADGYAPFKKQEMFLSIVADPHPSNRTTLSIGYDYVQCVVNIEDVEELINAWKEERNK